MSRIRKLLNSYSNFIAIPWKPDAAAAQRVLFCVYKEADELKLRAHIDEFELNTRKEGHDWSVFDLTDTFADWLSQQKYAKQYFREPAKLASILNRYLDYLENRFSEFLEKNGVTSNFVVAIKGVGSLFGFIKVKDLVDKLAPNVQGRLLVFFPGSYENSNYRLLDGYDGWNYHAVPITADHEF